MYSEFATKNSDYFPVFEGLFRKNDKYGLTSDSLEGGRDQVQEFLEDGCGRMLKPKFMEN